MRLRVSMEDGEIALDLAIPKHVAGPPSKTNSSLLFSPAGILLSDCP